MKDRIIEYTAKHSMKDLIDDNSLLLSVINCFNIHVKFGRRSVAEYCAANNVDCSTFLAVANLISFNKVSDAPISLPSLMIYIEKSHFYFLNTVFPNIRRKLIDAINSSETKEIISIVLKFYDDYVMEIRQHMEIEGESFFKYVKQLISGETESRSKASLYVKNHAYFSEKLQRLKYIIIRYCSEQQNNKLFDSVIYDIMNCENNLISHSKVEIGLFAPEFESLECRLGKTKNVVEAPNEPTPDNKTFKMLTGREKNVIKYIAHGMSNKEIATKLNISVNTVITYRRNISKKLNIHSTAGLTIFAVIHDLIDLKEMKLKMK